MTKKEKVNLVAELKKVVVDHVIYKKKYKYYRDTDKKIKGKYSHNFKVICSSKKQLDFKNLIKSEVTKFLKSDNIDFDCSKYDRKDPTKIIITTKFMTVIGKALDKSRYTIKIDYKY